MSDKFCDYRLNRSVINDLHVYTGLTIKGHKTLAKGDQLYIRIPKRARNELGISTFNEWQFKVIIAKKEESGKDG
jgi:hypothetical protein